MHRVHAIQHVYISSGYGYWLLVCLFLEQSLVSSPPQRYFQMQFSINHRRIFRVDPAFSVQQHQSEQVNPFCRRPLYFDGAQALYLQSTGYRPLSIGSMFLNELNAVDKAIPTFRRIHPIFRRNRVYMPAPSLIYFQTKNIYFQNLIPYSYIQTRCVVIYSIRDASIFSMFMCLNAIFS